MVTVTKKESVLVVACLAALVVLGAPAHAQESGADVWGKGSCSNCHGALAQGGAGGEQPAGPSLRATRLDRAALIETISCGRPGTAMPYNMTGAYTATACFGMPVGAVPAGTNRGANLTAPQVQTLVDFLLAEVVGKTRITRQSCATFLGVQPNDAQCSRYPAQ